MSRLFLISAISINLLTLGYFKYTGFILNILKNIIPVSVPSIILPIGISFYTFQTMSYSIDVYRGIVKPQKNIISFALYVTLFPQLIAGPIVNYKDVEDQINGRKESLVLFSKGVRLFCAGLFKKVILANQMGLLWDALRENFSQNGFLSCWVGIISYTLQIYFDFSGYSDMARGLGNMFGFEFLKNFNYPYISKSITEFWRRWHISLSTWFREYVYFPLGGSRAANYNFVVRNTFIVWLCTGMWHGANWTFLLWGMWHFLFIIFERIIGFDKLDIPGYVKHIYALFVVMIGWMLFRADDLYQASQYFLNLFGLNDNGFVSKVGYMFVREYWFAFLAAVLFSTPIARLFSEWMRKGHGKWVTGILYAVAQPLAYAAVYGICITYLAKGSYNPFIYFNF